MHTIHESHLYRLLISFKRFRHRSPHPFFFVTLLWLFRYIPHHDNSNRLGFRTGFCYAGGGVREDRRVRTRAMCQSQQVLELFPCTRAAPVDKAIEEMRGGDVDVDQDDSDGNEIRLGRSTVRKDCFQVSEMGLR